VHHPAFAAQLMAVLGERIGGTPEALPGKS
jgi:hypothetical protein